MKRFIFVLVLLFSLLLVFVNVSFASSPSINWSKWTTFNYQGSTLDFLNQICEIYFGEEFGDLNWDSGSTTQTAITNILNALENNTYKYMYYYISYSSNRYSFNIQWFSPSQTSYRMTRVSYNNANIFTCTYERRTDGDTIKGDYSTPIVAKYLIDTNESFTNMIFYKSIDYANVTPPSMSLKFTPSTSKYWNINGVNFYVYEMSRNFPYISIGSLFNKTSYENVVGNLYMFVDNNNFNNFIINTRNSVDGEQVTIDTNLLLFNQGYAVNFIDGDYTTPYYYIYFVTPRN